MSYGIQIFNQNNQVILDSETPAYMLSSEGTFYGTSPFVRNNITYYTYDLSSLPSGYLRFAKLYEGDSIYSGNQSNFAGLLVSNKPSLEIKIAGAANLFPDPTGYGLVSYNTSGQKTWFANAPVAVIEANAELPFFQGTFATTAEWVALTSALPWWSQIGPSTWGGRITGVKRYQGYYQWDALFDGLRPQVNVGPFSVSAIFAKE
jgi:hypothetical protein